MKDKLNPSKPIDDDDGIIIPSPPQPTVFHWNSCIVCGMDLSKKNPKKRIINGVHYISMALKKSYTLCGKKICWNCTFNLHKQFQKEIK